jgi:hypothetical protein
VSAPNNLVLRLLPQHSYYFSRAACTANNIFVYDDDDDDDDIHITFESQ